jgi:hypothetical protein
MDIRDENNPTSHPTGLTNKKNNSHYSTEAIFQPEYLAIFLAL